MARRRLETLTEQMFYVLLTLDQERHGYGVMQEITRLTQGRVAVGAGTLYTLLSRFEHEGLIKATGERENRKYYCMTPAGREVLAQEYARLRRQIADWERVRDGNKDGETGGGP